MFFRTARIGTVAGGNMSMAKAVFLSRLLDSWATLFGIVGLRCAVVPLACHISLGTTRLALSILRKVS